MRARWGGGRGGDAGNINGGAEGTKVERGTGKKSRGNLREPGEN